MSSELPQGWQSIRLDALVSARKGRKPAISKPVQCKGFVPYLDIQAIEKNEVASFAEASSSQLGTTEDIFVVWDGARSGWVGLGRKGAIGSTIMAMRPTTVDRTFLYRWLQSQFRYINTNTRGTGIPHVDPEVFWNLEIPIAPLGEQQRIVAKLEKLLEKVDACRARLEKIPILLKRFRQAVLAAACSGRLTADWRENDLKQQVLPSGQNELNELPDHWQWKRMAQLAAPVKGAIQSGPFGSNLLHSEFQSSGILAIGIDNVLDGSFSLGKQHRISFEKYAALKKYTARPLDVLVTVMATVGRCCVLPADLETAIITKHVYRISADQKIVDPFYLMHSIRGCPVVLSQMRTHIQGVTRPGINGVILKDISIALPPLPEQHEIVRRVEALFRVADRIEERYRKARLQVDKITSSILAKAFRGELVPQDPTDEPASELLKRIQRESASCGPGTSDKIVRRRKRTV